MLEKGGRVALDLKFVLNTPFLIAKLNENQMGICYMEIKGNFL